MLDQIFLGTNEGGKKIPALTDAVKSEG